MIQTYISELGFKVKPTGSQIGIISNEICQNNQKITFKEFVEKISQGRTFTLAAEFKNHVREKYNCLGLQIFAADIDSNNLSLNDIQSSCQDFDIPVAVIYESFRSQSHDKKWRLLFLSKTIVTDSMVALAILRKIKNHFNSDAAIIDPARMIFGTTPDKIRYASEIYFDAMTLSGLEIKPPIAISNFMSKKLPKKTRKLGAKALMHLQLAKNCLNNSQQSRYMCIFDAVLFLYNSELFCKEDIINEVLTAIAAKPRYANYDRSEQQLVNIIENIIKWAEVKNN